MPTTITNHWNTIQERSDKLGVGAWSYNKLLLFESCPLLFQKTYLLSKPPTTPSDKKYYAVPAKVGIFIHNVFEACVQDPTSKFEGVWMKLFSDAGFVEAEKALANRLNSNTRTLVSRLRTAMQRNDLAVQAEKKLVIPGVLGFADFVGTGPYPSHSILLDYKIFSETPAKNSKVKAQLRFYAMLMFLMHPELNQLDIGCVFVPGIKVKMYPSILRKHLTGIETDWVARITAALDMLEMYNEIKVPGLLLSPTKGDACQWCSDKEVCIAHKKRAKKRPKKSGGK